MEGIQMKTLKIISMLFLLFTVQAAFSQETVSTKKAAWGTQRLLKHLDSSLGKPQAAQQPLVNFANHELREN